MNRPRLVRRLFFILAAVLLVPLVLAGGVLGWLGTDSGENWLRKEGLGQLNSVLKDSGLFLSVESLSGPLPGKLSVRGLVLTDKHGPWLTVGEAEIILNLSRIVRGQLTVTSVMVADPVLLRLPDMPPSPDDMETDVLALAHGIPPWLPALRVEDLSVRGLRVPARLLDPRAAAAAFVDFDIDGTLAVPVYTELRTMLDVRRTSPDSDRLRLDAALSVNARGLDQVLDLSVDFTETEGGLGQAFVPELRGLHVTLIGKAPLENWKGALRLDAPGLGLVQGTVQGALLSPERALDLELNVTPDATLPAPWPAVLEKAGLTLSAAMIPGLMELKHAEVRLPGLGASAQVRGLSLKNIAHKGHLAGEIQFSVDTAGPPQAFSDGVPKPPFNAAAVLATLSGTVQSPELTLETHISGLRPDVRLPATDALIQSRLALSADKLTLNTDCSASTNGLQVHVDAALSGAPVSLARAGVFPDFSTPAGVEALLRELGLSLTVTAEAAPDALKAMAVAPAGQNAKGFTADLSATLNWPTASVSLSSPGVRVQDQAWSNLLVNVELGKAQPIVIPSAGSPESAERVEPAFTATASLATPHGPAHMELGGVWRENLLHISNLTARAVGLHLSGQARTMLEEAVRVDGRFSLRVDDWAALAPLLPVPLSAGSAVMDLRLAPEQNQSAEMTLKMTDMHVFGGRSDSGSAGASGSISGSDSIMVQLDSLNLSGNASDLFTSPRLTAALAVGSGTVSTTGSRADTGGAQAAWQAFTTRLKARVPGAASGLSELEVAANLVNLTAEGFSVPPLNVALTGGLARNGKYFNLDLRGEGLGLEPISGSVQVPIVQVASAQQNSIMMPDMTAPLSGFLRWQGPLGPVWRLVPVANCRVRGEGFVDVTLAGTLARPRPGGSIRLENVLFQELTQALELSHMRAEVLFSPTGPASIKASGNGGRAGEFTFSGTVDVFDPQFPLDVRGQFNRVAPFLRQDLRLNFSGEAGARGMLLRPEVFANITVNSGELRVEKLPGGGVTTLDAVTAEASQTPSTISETLEISKTSTASNPSSPETSHTIEAPASAEILPPAVPETGVLNVTVTVPNRFFVRGHGLESEWGGKLHVTGPLNAPVVNGQLASVRGTMSFLGKLFVLSKGEITFDGATPPRPMLNVQVTYARQDFTALIELLGQATSPRLRLSSQPHLPTGDIVAQILFGSTASGLGRAEAIQLGATLASLSLYNSQGGSIVDITRESLGLDVLRVGSRRGLGSSTSDNMRNFQPFGNTGLGQSGAGAAGLSRENAPDSENDLALEVGKYVLDNVYVGVEQGMGQASTGVVVDIEVTPSVNLEAKTTGRGTELGVIWSWDY